MATKYKTYLPKMKALGLLFIAILFFTNISCGAGVNIPYPNDVETGDSGDGAEQGDSRGGEGEPDELPAAKFNTLGSIKAKSENFQLEGATLHSSSYRAETSKYLMTVGPQSGLTKGVSP